MSEDRYVHVGIIDVLFLIFLVLKLTGLINWSWWWVTSPLWIGTILVLIFYGIVYLIDKD